MHAPHTAQPIRQRSLPVVGGVALGKDPRGSQHLKQAGLLVEQVLGHLYANRLLDALPEKA